MQTKSGLTFFLSLHGPIILDVAQDQLAPLAKHLASYGVGGFETEVQTLPRDPQRFTLRLGKGMSAIATTGTKLKQAAEAAEHFATAIRTGATATEAMGQFVERIPIVGTFKQAGDAIRELVTGEKAAVEQQKNVNEQLARTAS